MAHRHSHPVPLLEPVFRHYFDYFPPGPLHSLTASVIFEIWGRSLWDFAAAILGTDATRGTGHVSAPSLLSSAGQVSYLTPPGKIKHDKTCWTMSWCSRGAAFSFRHPCSGEHPLIQGQNLLTSVNFVHICSHQATKCLQISISLLAEETWEYFHLCTRTEHNSLMLQCFLESLYNLNGMSIIIPYKNNVLVCQCKTLVFLYIFCNKCRIFKFNSSCPSSTHNFWAVSTWRQGQT